MHSAPGATTEAPAGQVPLASVDDLLAAVAAATAPVDGLRTLAARLAAEVSARAVGLFAVSTGGVDEVVRDGHGPLPTAARRAAELCAAEWAVTSFTGGPQGATRTTEPAPSVVDDAVAVPVQRGSEQVGVLVAVGIPPGRVELGWLGVGARAAALVWPPAAAPQEAGERDRRLAALGDLAGGIAHDFNNALTSVLGSVSLARLHGGLSDSLDDLLSEAEQACLRARRLTRQLLTFAGGGEPIRRATDLGALVREIVDEAGSDRRHRYALRVDEGLSAAWADEDQIRQATLFLIDHARAVMPDGGEIRVRVHGRPAERQVELIVEDRGPGMSAAELERIWDPYATGQSGIRGLALSAVHSIARRHGGSVTAQSECGSGSTFRLRIPVVGTEDHAPDLISVGARATALRVLVMDDDPTVRSSLVRMLQHLGHTAEAVEDGAEAVDAWVAARDGHASFDLCVMDLTVPHGVGGREAIGRLLDVDPTARAIVASGYSKDPIMARFREHGFVGVLEKPCEMASLARAAGRDGRRAGAGLTRAAGRRRVAARAPFGGWVAVRIRRSERRARRGTPSHLPGGGGGRLSWW